MASSILSNLSSAFRPSQLSSSSRGLFTPYCTPTFIRTSFAAKIRASSTAFAETRATDPVVIEKAVSSSKNILACPVCYDPLNLIGANVLSVKETHLELTVASGAKEYDDAMPMATELFRTPLISFLYERGWRQNFVWGGFPGAEEEFEMMKDYLKPILGGNILDASCGSGLFSRLFAKSGLFSLVTALDYSENMLRQCYEFIKQEENFPKENLILVRADIARLPFVSGSLDAVHAGAAIHCWPSPSSAVAEVSRVLRPGGVFVATTYILDGPFSFIPFLKPISQFTQASGSKIFLSERELEDVCRACGLVNFTCTRNSRFIMFCATKPI
ncbi:methyltransferase chloroplastic [Salix suchowensis]|nr:methyltransferase chloroplastic [Salix suchowensis]